MQIWLQRKVTNPLVSILWIEETALNNYEIGPAQENGKRKKKKKLNTYSVMIDWREGGVSVWWGQGQVAHGFAGKAKAHQQRADLHQLPRTCIFYLGRRQLRSHLPAKTVVSTSIKIKLENKAPSKTTKLSWFCVTTGWSLYSALRGFHTKI